VQIKTDEMHRIAEYGVAAHWRYKEGAGPPNSNGRFEERMAWLRQLLEWQRETPDTNEFLESVREDLFHDQVFVYTPKGDIVELAAGATPIDFAYKIHTDLGHRISGAKVNGRLVSLDTPLQNGDTVEVVAGKTGRGPSPDWLNLSRGYVATNSARQKIRSWFNRQLRSVNVTRGRELLRRELHRMGVKLADREVLALCRYESMEDLLAALGSGELSDSALANRLTPQLRADGPDNAPWLQRTNGAVPLDSPSSGISVLGVGDLLTRIAACCAPIQGDSIIGFVTRSRGVSVHKVDCINVLNEDEKERLVPVSWGQKQELYPVRIRIEAIDRVGLLRDVTTKLSEDKINIAWVVTRENADATVSMELTIHISGLTALNRVFSRIEGIRGVTSVSRVTSSPLRQTTT
jgi:GTP pyrophosphokinase